MPTYCRKILHRFLTSQHVAAMFNFVPCRIFCLMKTLQTEEVSERLQDFIKFLRNVVLRSFYLKGTNRICECT